jgi:hypothetical protein
MNDPSASVEIALRIPGKWSHPGELIERLPADCRLTPEALILPDGTEIEFGAARADGQFAGIFRSSCRQPATEEELARADSYTVNVLLSGPGGSGPAARACSSTTARSLMADRIGST